MLTRAYPTSLSKKKNGIISPIPVSGSASVDSKIFCHLIHIANAVADLRHLISQQADLGDAFVHRVLLAFGIKLSFEFEELVHDGTPDFQVLITSGMIYELEHKINYIFHFLVPPLRTTCKVYPIYTSSLL